MANFCGAVGIILYLMQYLSPADGILSEEEKVKQKFYGTAKWFVAAFIILKAAWILLCGDF